MAYANSVAVIATPVGPIRLTASDGSLTSVTLESALDERIDPPPAGVLREAADQLGAYFDRGLTEFDVPLAPAATPRGAALRAAIVAIGYGETLSYGALARIAGSSPRAIGQACARNPFPIIVPCHRVTAAGDRLGAYSGGDGPATKRWLLDHEQAGTGGRTLL